MDRLLSAYGNSDDEDNSSSNAHNNNEDLPDLEKNDTGTWQQADADKDPPRKRKIEEPHQSDLYKRQRVDASTVPGRYVSKRERLAASSAAPNDTATQCDNTQPLGQSVPALIEARLQHQSRANSCPSRVISAHKCHSSAVSAVRWQPLNGALLATCSLDGSVLLFDPFTRAQVVREWWHTAAVKDVQWHLNGEQLFSGGFDKSVKVTDVNTCQVVRQFNLPEYVTCIKPHPADVNSVVIGTFKGGCESWDLRSDSTSGAKVFKGLQGNMQGMEFINQGTQLVTCADITTRNSMDKAVMVWDWESAAPVSNQIYNESFTCTSVRRHPTSAHFLTQSNGGYVAIFSSNSPFKLNKHKRFEGHSVTGFRVGFDISPDGHLIASGSADGQMYCYQYSSAAIIRRVRVSNTAVTEVAFHPVLESHVAVGAWDGTVSFWQ